MKAGQRNKKKGGGGGGKAILVVLAVLLPLLLAGGAVGGYLLLKSDKKTTGGGTATKSPSPTVAPTAGTTQVPAAAIKILAFTSQSGDKHAANTIDGNPDTFWSAAFPSKVPGNPPDGIDRRPFIRYGFDAPLLLTRLEIRNGASGADFAQRPRVRKILLKFDDGTTLETELKDDGEAFQTVSLKTPKKVSSVQINIVTHYPGTANEHRYRWSFAEVRFFRKA